MLDSEMIRHFGKVQGSENRDEGRREQCWREFECDPAAAMLCLPFLPYFSILDFSEMPYR